MQGRSEKMRTAFEGRGAVQYWLRLSGNEISLNPYLGKSIRLEFRQRMSCIHCDRPIKKTFSQGYCYPCFRDLARCDRCIVKPELCHFAQGSCREPDWGKANCMRAHTVYLAISSGLKVGITRGVSPLGRWMDQGATQGLAIQKVATRLESGQVEVAFKSFVADKTNWRKMLQGVAEPHDLPAERDALYQRLREETPETELAGEPLDEAEPVEIEYPVIEYPKKIVSHNFDKNNVLEGTLLGIKGQYLILDTAVVNIRKYGGYHFEWRV